MAHQIDQETCKKCGACAAICPANAILYENRLTPLAFHAGRTNICIACGQCMAVCPTLSIRIDGLDYEKDFIPLTKAAVAPDALSSWLTARRSVRCFKSEPVPRELLEQILAMIALAPMGFPPHRVGITIVTDPAKLKQAVSLMAGFYDQLMGWVRHSIMSRIIAKKAGKARFKSIKEHVVPIMTERLPYMKQTGYDGITRGAPVLMIFDAAEDDSSAQEDALIQLTYGLLAAHSLGLGACAIGLVPPAVNKDANLRALFGIPPERTVVTSMVLGYPKHKYLRGIRRTLPPVRWV